MKIVTREYGEGKIIKMVYINQAVTSTPLSILIESLVRHLCNMIEADDENALRVYNAICKQLFDMKLIDESYLLGEFDGMRTQYQRALLHLLSSAQNGEGPIDLQEYWANLCADMSHYIRDFDELEYIAGGGFGQVYRVRHRLDGTEYAVKKVRIRATNIKSIMEYLAEVKTFASLSHPNVVQYKAAWMELGFSKSTAIEPNYDTSSSSLNENSNHPTATFEDDTDDTKVSDFTVEFDRSKPMSYSNVCSSNTQRVRASSYSLSEGGQAICPFNFEDRPRKRHGKQWATLYIQMSLCQLTLRQWLDSRNEADQRNNSALVPVTGQRDQLIEMFGQIVEGLEYIHKKGIVHHDIKPSNIFIMFDAGQICVQLGDFGLACPLQRACHTLPFGTKLYAAPEQLTGSCDPKSDIYSVGIVLFEMVKIFHTEMEKIKQITELRNGTLALDVAVQDSQFAKIIGQLVTKDPSARPDATEILQSLRKDNPFMAEIQTLKGLLFEKDAEIQRLKNLLDTAGVPY